MYSILKIGHFLSIALLVFVGLSLVWASIGTFGNGSAVFRRKLYYGMVLGVIVLFVLTATSQGQRQLGLHENLTTVVAQYDTRQWMKERSILKGSIFDRSGELDRALAVSEQFGNKEFERIYPYGTASGHVIGYSDRERGRTGIEAAYFSTLIGLQFGYLENLKQFVSGKFNTVPKGTDVYLTIDSRMQKAAYNAIGNKKGAVVVLDPKTGEVVALVSTPGFSPDHINNDEQWNNLLERHEDAPLFNRALQGLYPPGSIMKIIIAAAALEAGLDPIYFSGPDGYKPDEMSQVIHEHEYEAYNNAGNKWMGHGNLSMTKAFQKSSNVYFSRLSMALDNSIFENTIKKFGFKHEFQWNTSSSSLHDYFPVVHSFFPESDVLMPEQKCWSSLGQYKVLMSPMHVSLVVAAVANNGYMPRPSLELGRFPRYSAKVISSGTAQSLQKMLRTVVENDTGFRANVSGINVAGKTGTAEIGSRDPHSWFASFAPAENARLVVVVLIENGGYGGKAAATAARKIYLEAQKLGYFGLASQL